MKIKPILVSTLLLMSFGGFAQRINPITKAVLDGYAQILKEDPKDYQTLYERASQYYNLSEYSKSLEDIEKAIKYTPSKETTLLEREYSLLADISIQMNDYDKAYTATEKALSLNPESYGNLYKMGNILLYQNRPNDAYKAFQGLQRLQSRSSEAFFGMARAAAMMGNKNEAETLMKQAAENDPSNYVTYCRLGDLYVELGEPEKAATNYLAAYSMANDPTRPLESLVDLSRTKYSAVDKALEYAISVSESKIPMYYMRASLANESGNFAEAERSCKELLALPDGMDASVYRMLAQAQHALNKDTDALENIDKALKYKPIADNYALKSEILLNSNKSAALAEAEKGLGVDATNEACVLAGARAAILNGDYDKGLSLLNTAVMTDPGNVEALVTRAYLNTELLKDGKLGSLDYSRASSQETESFPGLAYLAIAKAKSGKSVDANTLIENYLKEHSNADDCYYAAVYYAQTSQLEKAKAMVDKALAQGYQNVYNLNISQLPGFNLQPIRYLLK